MFFSAPSVVLISGPQKMHCQTVKEKINEQNTGIIETESFMSIHRIIQSASPDAPAWIGKLSPWFSTVLHTLHRVLHRTLFTAEFRRHCIYSLHKLVSNLFPILCKILTGFSLRLFYHLILCKKSVPDAPKRSSPRFQKNFLQKCKKAIDFIDFSRYNVFLHEEKTHGF